MPMITSPQNPRVKLVQALQSRARTRRKEGKVVLEGVRLVQDALAQGYLPEFVFYTPDFDGNHLPNAEMVSDAVMKAMSDTQQPQGVIAVFPMPQAVLPVSPARILILDAIRDPGNLGTILRTAGAAGVQAVILSPDCVDAYNPKVLRAGMGAHFRLPVIAQAWEDIAEYIALLTLYLADSSGDQRYDQVDWSQPWALLIGSEAHGAGEQATQLVQQRVFIPTAAQTESINAAMAASVILFEAQRQLLML